MAKVKLTLSVEKGTIEKAKAVGLNLSELTEASLSLNSFEGAATDDEKIQAYRNFLKAISDIAKQWDVYVVLGSEQHRPEDPTIKYGLWRGLIDVSVSEFDEHIRYITLEESLPVDFFNEPEIIVKRLVDALYNAKERNRHLIEKLELFTNILRLSGLGGREKK